MKKKILAFKTSIVIILALVFSAYLVNAVCTTQTIGQNLEMKFTSVVGGTAQQVIINSIPGAGQVWQAVQIANCFVGGVDTCIMSLSLAQLESAAWSEIGNHIGEETTQVLQNLKDICGEAKEVTVDKNGQIEMEENGYIKIDDEANIGNLINKDFNAEDISVKNINWNKKEGINTFTTKEESVLKIKTKDARGKERTITYDKIKEKGTIKVDSEGNVFEADLVSSQATSFEFGNQKIDVAADTSVVYKDGKITLKPAADKVEKEFNFGLSQLNKEGKPIGITSKIRGDGKIEIDGNQISGKHFWIEDVEISAVKENAVVGLDADNAKHFTIQDADLKKNDIRVVTTKEQIKIYLDGAQIPENVRNGVSFKPLVGDVENLEIRAENMKVIKLGRKFNTELIVDDGKLFGDPENMIKVSQEGDYKSYLLNARIKTTKQDILFLVNEKDESILRSADNALNLLSESEIKNEQLKNLGREELAGDYSEGGLFGPERRVNIKIESYYDVGPSQEKKYESQIIKYDVILKNDISGGILKSYLKGQLGEKSLSLIKEDKKFSQILEAGIKQGSQIIIVNDIKNKFSVLSLKEKDMILLSIILPKGDEEIATIIEQAERDLLKSSYGKG